MAYLLMDTETGGLSESNTILTAYFAVVNDSLDIVDELSLSLKPDDNNYIYTDEALKINGIDLIEHHKSAIFYSDARIKLAKFLCEHVPMGSTKLIPLGHNVTFDLKMIDAQLLNLDTNGYLTPAWRDYVSEVVEDTMVMGKALKEQRRLPDALSNALGSYAEYFLIRTFGLHDAKIDCNTTLQVYKKLKGLNA